MTTGEERQQFVAQIIEAVRAGLPAPEKVDLKGIEKAAEADAVRGARLRQEGEEAAKRQSPIAAALAHPAVLVRKGMPDMSDASAAHATAIQIAFKKMENA